MSQLRQEPHLASGSRTLADGGWVDLPWPYRPFARAEEGSPPRASLDRLHADRAIALAVTVLIGMRISIGFGATVGLLASVAILPIWAASALTIRSFRALAWLGAFSIASGFILTLAAPFSNSVAYRDVLVNSLQVFALVATTGGLVWSAMLLGAARMAVAFGVGAALGIPFNISTQENLWKFTYALAVGVCLLALVDQTRRLGVQLLVLIGLAGIGILSDSRSNSSFLLMAGILLVGQRLVIVGPTMTRSRRAFSVFALTLAAGLAMYQLVVGAILEGAFGELTQERTQAQIDQSGSLILGGRPEIAASLALISRNPLGLGSGTRASWADVVAAKQAMWEIGYNPENGYVQRYMFGQGVEVHSMLGDAWLRFGIAGAALACLIAVLVVSTLVRDFSRGAVTAVFAYISIRFIWDFLFSPLSSTVAVLPLTLALAVYSSAIPRVGLESATVAERS